MSAALWGAELDRLRAVHRVPGAQLGILRLDGDGAEAERLLLESGVLDLSTRAPVERRSKFQIGSITKVVTAAAALRCAELGLIDLDAPVRDLLPGLRLADESVAEAVSVADLLCHRNGIEGERYRETGEDDAAVARYVDGLGDAAQVHPLRSGFSYSNTGYVIAGRAIETATGLLWSDAVVEHVLAPMGVRGVSAPIRPEQVTSPATGHVFGADDRLVRADPWRIPPGMGPAGMLTADASAVLDLLALSLRGGVGEGGTTVLSPSSADAMLTPVVPAGVPGVDGWALGWMRERWDGVEVFGHDGGTNGQYAFARAVPAHRIAYVLLTNGGHARSLYEDLMPLLAEATVGSPGPSSPRPADDEPPTAALAYGRYDNGDGSLLIEATDEGPAAAELAADGAAGALSPIRAADSGEGLVWRRPGEKHWRTLVMADADAVLLGTRRMRRAVD